MLDIKGTPVLRDAVDEVADVPVETLEVGYLVTHEAGPDHGAAVMPRAAVGREDGLRAQHGQHSMQTRAGDVEVVEVQGLYGLDILRLARYEGPRTQQVGPVSVADLVEAARGQVHKVAASNGTQRLEKDVQAQHPVPVREHARRPASAGVGAPLELEPMVLAVQAVGKKEGDSEREQPPPLADGKKVCEPRPEGKRLEPEEEGRQT